MSKETESKTGPKPTAKEQRDARIKAALRANLQRRKAQGRARKSAEAPKSE